MSDQTIANLHTISLLVPADRTATANCTGVDISAFDGNVACIIDTAAGTGTTPTLDVKLQDCATVGGTYADIPGAAITQVTDAAASTQKLVFNANNVKTFVRPVVTISGTTPHFICNAVLVGSKQYT